MNLKHIFLLLVIVYLNVSKPTHRNSDKVLSRGKRTIGNLFPVSFGRINFIGARLQVFPHAPLGADSQALFDVDIIVPRSLAFLIPGQ